MRGLTPAQIVRAWERGATRAAADRALAALAEASGEAVDALRELPIGARDDRLLALRERTFGDEMSAVVACACGERVELAFSTEELRRGGAPAAAVPRPIAFEGATFAVRPLTTGDLLVAAAAPDAASARRVLAARALSPPAAADDPAHPLPDALVAAVAQAVEQADPGAVRTLDVACPSCGARQDHDLDVAGFVWAEVEGAALRLLRDVHVLARGYGWREEEILALTPLRRRAYLELLG